MSDLRLSLAIHESLHTRDIIDGRVKPDAIDLMVSRIGIETALSRFGVHFEFDIAEYSLANYCAYISRDEHANMVGLPIFTSRAFRQSAIFVRADSSLEKAEDIAGLKVGIPQWSQTATVYVRGYLVHQADVPLSSIHWVQAGLNEAGRKDNAPPVLPAGVELTPRPDRTLDDLLLKGEIDAIISARPPKSFLKKDGGVRRLFANPRLVEEQYFKQTGVFPIMHLIVMRRDTYEANRWIAKNLLEAFELAKSSAVAKIVNLQASYVPSAWMADVIAENNEMLFADGDVWPYGIHKNYRSIESFLQYAFEQGVTLRRLAPEEIFAEETLQIVRV